MEILCFSFGDARNPQTWSNVPYYLIRELEAEGHRVSCVDIYQGKFLQNIAKICNRLFRVIFGKDTMILIELLPIVKPYYNHIVAKGLKAHPNVKKIIFFSYSVIGKGNENVEKIFFNDFTVEYVLSNIHMRKPIGYESTIIEYQDVIMNQSDKIISLFPKAARNYAMKYGDNKVEKIPGHIINCDRNILNIEKVIETKYSSRNILFIGRKSYIYGVKVLIEALEIYNMTHAPIDLSIIGMTSQDIGLKNNDHIKAYGVLNKANEKEKQVFYDKIERAKTVINTTKNWAGMSSMVESMFLYTPVITAMYDEFKEIFGSELDFGYYCKAEDVDDLINYIEKMFELSKDEFALYCNNAHKAVESFTWENCVKVILE